MGTSGETKKEEKNKTIFYNYVIINNNEDNNNTHCINFPNKISQNSEIKAGDAAPIQNINNANKNIEIIFQNGKADNKISINFSQNNNVKENINNNNEILNENNIQNGNNNVKYSTDINNDTNSETSPELKNIDNNLEKEYEKPRPDINNENERNIDPNIGGQKKIFEKKETKKGSEVKQEYNPIFGKFKPTIPKEEKDNLNFTKQVNLDNNDENENKISHNQEKMKNTGTFGNPDLDFKHKINDVKTEVNTKDHMNYAFDDDDLELSQNILCVSYSYLNLKDPKDFIKFNDDFEKKFKEGYFGIYLYVDNLKPSFYYVKIDSTIKSIIQYHNKIKGITEKAEECTAFIGKKSIDINAQIKDLNLKPISKIMVHL